MSRFLPLTIRFVGGGSMVVTTVAEARTALAGSWKNKEAPDYLEAVRLVDDAIAGICRPAIAFAAFKKVAMQQGLLKPSQPSAALTMLDDLSLRSKPPR
ncbi:DUF982 domain-containing protein [Mesorhizobium sp. M2D.F.Ca.ET.185.01.1.1]|uniref:DUF982 domain-containing protein n=1 Tax=unclassified Mesorhizobium TaxID=325217 RepID=UPI000FC9B647|nr:MULTISPECIES: DUF982 domain-containing protein [unclassified Mesorhizobium]TGP74807.1 DUF982 domain-containing protein [bacterium M00.F.Ca.ET.227.01.1.1]TGP84702.1 DUF982 domain-containing protein [bacterium M00.F.Ca.ET.221.01.1.1]TGP87759.1 DUF982 domain-containing protein [bacterium M00.F.Ca.ET.222.01.1.1]TGT70962.1 DUF982 domain-containing protein [bacterium M00.F.Ca.ET.159.01.1.1]TGT82605.1 DUF982 domain-containing protein [bacterium M00.F.Ca.ET.157.01.1.1]TGT97171.1 DUF982 domain-cont